MRRGLILLAVAFGLFVVAVSARTASYPTSVHSFTTKSSGDTIQATHINDLQDEVTAIEQGLLNGLSHVLTLTNTGLHLLDTDASHDLIVKPGSDLTADRTLTITTGDADRTLTLGADISLSAQPYVPSGTDVALADGGTGASLSDPGADRILFWDDSAGATAFLTAGTGLSISDTTISASTTSHYVLTGTAGATRSGSQSWDPADATTYYIGQSNDLTSFTTALRNRIYLPVAGTITGARFSLTTNGTLGSNETSTVSLRLNGSSDTAVSTAVTADSAFTSKFSSALSIAVSAGDWVEFKWVTPTWTTNPTEVSVSWQVVVQE